MCSADKKSSGLKASSVLGEILGFLITGAFVLVFFAPRFFSNSSFILGDGLEQNVPHRVYATRTLAEWRLPHWSDVTFGGYPFLSDPQTAVFFPPYLVMALLGWMPASSLRFDAVAMGFVLAAALGTYALARVLHIRKTGAVAAGVFFGLNGYMINHLSHTVIMSAIAAAIWGMCFLALAMQRSSVRAWWAATLCFASSVLSGHWQTAMFGWEAAAAGGLYLALRQAWMARSPKVAARNVISLATLFVVAGLAAMVQVLPTLEFLKHSTRERLSLAEATAYSLPLKQLAGLLMPGLYQPLFWRVPPENRWELCWRTWGIDGAWEFHFWIGLIAFSLMVYGVLVYGHRISSWLLAACFVFTVVAAMGQDVSLYQWLYRHMPGFQQIRIPPRMIWVGYLAGALLIGRAVMAVATLPKWPRRRIASVVTIVTLGLLIVAGCYFVAWGLLLTDDWTSAFELLLVINPHYKLGVDRSYADFVKDIQVQALVGLAFGGAVTLWVRLAGRWRKPAHVLAWAAVLLLWAELTIYGFHKNIRSHHRGFENAVTPLHALIYERVEGRLHTLVPGPWEKNTGEASGIPITSGYNPMILRWVNHSFPPEEPTYGRKSRENMLDVWNVSHVAAPGHRCVVNLPESMRPVELTTGTGAVFLSVGSHELKDGAEYIAAGSRLRGVALVTAAMGVAGELNGTTVGVVRLLSDAGEELSTYPLRLGYETAEWKYDNPELSPELKHHAPLRAYTVRNDFDASATTYFLCRFAVETTEVVKAIRVETLLQSPRWFAVSHIIEETAEGKVVVHPAVESLGYQAVISRDPNQWVYFRRATAPGWAWLVPEAKPVSYKNDYRWIRERLSDPQWDYRRVVWVDKADFPTTESLTSSNAPAPEHFRGSLKVHHPFPEYWLIHTESNDRCWLFLSKTWYPGWRATVDGKPARIVRANGPFSAVAIPAGNHVITFEYTTPWLWFGAPISGLTWLLALTGVVKGRPRLREIAAKTRP